jgi:hypothetical protein
VLQQALYNPRSLDVYCWSPRAIGVALLMALRDWAHREGYRSLSLLVAQESVNALGADAEADGYVQDVWSLGV